MIATPQAADEQAIVMTARSTELGLLFAFQMLAAELTPFVRLFYLK